MNHSSEIARSARLTRFKIGATLVACAAIGAYLLQLRATGNLAVRDGFFKLNAGDYHHVWSLDLTLAIRAGAGVLFFLLAAGLVPDRLIPRRRPIQAAAIAVILALALSITLTPMLNLSPTDPVAFGLALGIGALAGWLLTDPGPAGRLLPSLASLHRRLPPAVLYFAGALLGAAAGWISWRLIHQGLIVMTDSQSQISQARLLASGHLTYPIGAGLRPLIEVPAVLTTVPSYSQYPPGYILALVPVIAARLPAQIFNLLATALLVPVTAALARQVAGRAAIPAAILMLAASPFLLVMPGSAMNHVLCALVLTAAALCFLPIVAGGAAAASVARCAAGGLFLGWAVTIRPVTGLAHALVWLAALLLLAWRDRRAPSGARWTVRVFAWTIAGLALPAAIFMLYNAGTTGHPLRMPYMVSNPELHRLGFRDGGTQPYSPLDALDNLAAGAIYLNLIFLGWAIGSWVALLVWWNRTRLTPGERVLAALIVGQTFLYALYHFFDLLLGPRFLFEILPLAVVLAAAGLAPTLRAGGRGAGLLLIVLLLFTAQALRDGVEHWKLKFSLITGAAASMYHFMESQGPRSRPTVVLITPPHNEVVGTWFPALPGEPPIYFILDSNEEAARRRPELAGFDWIRVTPPTIEDFNEPVEGRINN